MDILPQQQKCLTCEAAHTLIVVAFIFSHAGNFIADLFGMYNLI